MIVNVASVDKGVHLKGGGFKEGYIPVFTSSILVTGLRDEVTSQLLALGGFALANVSWAWSIVYGGFPVERLEVNDKPKLIHVKDRTRENAIAEPCYAGIMVNNNTKMSYAGLVTQDYEFACMQGEYAKIPIPVSMGTITNIPANMFGLKVGPKANTIEGLVGFLGIRSFTIGTSSNVSITIILRSSIMKRIY